MGARFIVGDVLEVLRTLPDDSVDLVLTSPPFLALRSYLPADHPQKDRELGSEPTPGAFVDALLDVVEECRRVLAPHGSLCIELGDTYAGSGGAGGDYGENGLREGQERFRQVRVSPDVPDRGMNAHSRGTTKAEGMVRLSGGRGWPQDKSLTLIPELFRISLAYGVNPLTGRTTEPWRIRNVVRWVRPNPPVGALGDKFRPATSEMVVATMSRTRYFDLDAVRVEPGEAARKAAANPGRYLKGKVADAQPEGTERTGWAYWDRETNTGSNPAGAPPLDWWAIPTEPYKGAHYAVWPRALLTKPILSMCPAYVCCDCGTALGSIDESPRNVLRGVRRPDQGAVGEVAEREAQASVLLQGVLEPEQRTEPSDDARVDQGFQGLHLGQSPAASDGEPRGLRHGAPSGDGGEDGAVANGRGRGPSPERGEGRQPAGEPGLADQEGARLDPEGEASPDRVPVVRARRAHAGNGTSCDRCGSTNLRSGRVLDPFAGSGTTLAIATGHGRDAIGVDIDSRNADLAMQRCGMFVTVEHHNREEAS